ncbi:MAG TPA: site-2 protease family protein [Kofleriaceae bacterium]|nr:site-2 protease family protein [Kofleriaceae bacterium]
MHLTPDKIRWILIYVLVLVISVALHEFGHAIMADKLGDDTPRRQGRVTLNPLAHADPIGTLLLPLLGSIYGAVGGHGGGFGWGKPVQWQPHRIRRGISMSTAKILVAVAGPSMNLVLATVLACVHALLISQQVLALDSQLGAILMFAVVTNFVLFFFNLLPVPPLDGGHVAQSFMPYRHRDKFDNFARYSPFIVLGFMLIPQLQVVFLWPAYFLASHLYHLLGVPF